MRKLPRKCLGVACIIGPLSGLLACYGIVTGDWSMLVRCVLALLGSIWVMALIVFGIKLLLDD